MNRSSSPRGRRVRGGRGRRGQGTGRERGPNSPGQFQLFGQFQSSGQFRSPLQSHDSFPSGPTPLSVGYGESPSRPFPSDSTPSFSHSPPHHSNSSDSKPDVRFVIDTGPDLHFTDNPSGSGSTFPPIARDGSPGYRQERVPGQHMSWQREGYQDLSSEDGMLGKHKRFPDPSSDMGFADDKRVRLDVEFQSPKQERSTAEVGTSSEKQVDDTKEEEERHLKDGDPEAKKDSEVPKPSQLSPEDVTAINKKVLMVEGTITHNQYFCSLCYAQLNCRKNLEKHMHANEHIRRIMNLHNSKTFPYFCEVCSCGCPHKEVYEQHLRGKKHLRNTSIVSRKQDAPLRRPLGDLLDELFKESVAQIGDGLTLGMSSHMMKFFSMPGPFVGLQYAEEVGLQVDPNPQYTCTLCSVTVDAANHHLHFTSSAHRVAVLKSDYPEKYSELMRLNLKKSAFSDKLKEMASEIESKEGRKVELIKRKILKPSPGGTFSSKGKFSSDQSSHSPAQHSLQKKGTGSVRGRGRGRGQMLPYGGRFSAQSGEIAAGRGADGDVNRARGRGGRGGGRYFGAAATQDLHMDSSSSWKQDQQSQRRYGPILHQQATMASSNFVPIGTPHFVSPTASSPYLQQQSPSSSSSSSSSWISVQPQQQPPQVWTSPLQAMPPQVHPSWTQGPPQAQPSWTQGPSQAHPPFIQQQQPMLQQAPVVQQPPSLVQQPPSLVQPQQTHPQSWGAHPGNAGMTKSSFGGNPSGAIGSPAIMSPSHEVPSHQQQQPHAQKPYQGQQPQSCDNPQASNDDQVTQLLRNIQGAGQDVIQQLSNISSEEDADAALKLSSALTQALLAYRIKSVSTSIPENPLSAVISSLQGLGQLNLHTPTTSSSNE